MNIQLPKKTIAGALLPASIASSGSIPFLSAHAAEATTAIAQQPDSMIWTIFIAIMVLGVTGSVVYLCCLAIQAWDGYWKQLAIAPLLALGVWVVLILVSKFLEPGTHRLWPFEIFAWSMMTTIYLVVLMTAKRTFDKADQQSQGKQ